MSTSNDIAAQARDWIDQLNSGTGSRGTWRLQLLDKRVRLREDSSASDSSESYVVNESPMKIRRFCNCMPWALVNEAIKYLVSTAPYTGLVYNGVPLPGKYAPTRTRWIRDDQTSVVEGRGNNGTYTLVQDLVEIGSGDTFEFDGGGNCGEDVHYEYVWDAFDFQDLEPGGQGVTRSIQAISRSSEDGTFDYVVVTRKARTQIGDARTVRDNSFETVSQQTWDNVYTKTVSASEKYCDENGADLAGLTDAMSSLVPGRTVELSVQLNQDCTYRVVKTTTTAKGDVPTDLEDRKTQFSHSRKTTTRAVDSDDAPDEAESAGGGRTHTVRTELRPDGLYDVTSAYESELSVDSVVIERSRTLRSVRTRITHRNQESCGSYASMPLRVGQTVRIEKTDGCRYNITLDDRDSASSVGPVRVECARTAFQHEHGVTVNQAEAPSESHVESAGGGVVHRMTAVRTDDDTWDVHDQTTSEIAVESAVVERTRGLRSATKRTTHRNVESCGSYATRALNVGESVRISMTDGRRYDIVHAETDPNVSSVDTAAECVETKFEHRHSSSRNQASRPADSHVAPAGGGIVRRRSVSRTDDDTWDVRSESTREINVESAVVEYTRGQGNVKVRKTHRNRVVSDVAPLFASLRVGQSVRIEMNDGGTYNIVEESYPEANFSDVALGARCGKNAFEHVHASMYNTDDFDSESVVSVGEDQGYRDDVKVTRNVDKSVTVEKVRTTGVPREWQVEVSTEFAYSFTQYFRNQTKSYYESLIRSLEDKCNAKAIEWKEAGRPASSYGISPSVNMNDVGLYDGSVTWHCQWSPNSAGQTGETDTIEAAMQYSMSNGSSSTQWGHTGCGRGVKALYDFLSTDVGGPGTQGVNHLSFNFDPTTGWWSGGVHVIQNSGGNG